MEDAPLLSARGLTRRFGAATALDGIDLEVLRGEPVALSGVNGAGKTTLLRVLSGALRPTSGTLVLDGVDARRRGLAIRGRIGLLSHQTLLYDDLTARENLLFFAALHGLSDAASAATEGLERVGLSSRADDPVRALSRGMQQRVALARALLHRPALLLLDEPATGLDARSSQGLREALREAGARGTTWVMATHDVEEGLDLCARWVALRQGRVVDAGASAGEDAARLRALVRGTA